MAGFPVARLRPSGGAIAATIGGFHATPKNGQLTWSVAIAFPPMEYDGDEIEPRLGCDRIVIPIRDWRDLEGKTIDASELESTFTTVDHDPMPTARIAFRERRRLKFRVTYEGTVEFTGAGDDGHPEMPIRVRAWLPFTGLSIFQDPIRTLDEAKRVAAKHFDMKHFREPTLHGGCFHFEPRPLKRVGQTQPRRVSPDTRRPVLDR